MVRLLALAALLASAAVAQTPAAQTPAAVVAPGETLVVEGVPPVPAALAEATARYTESRSAAFVGWHPTRREMLVSTRFAATPQLHAVAMPGGARTQLTFFAEPVGGGTYTRGAGPRGEGRSVVFGRDAGGNEFAQLYRLDLDTRDVALLSDGGRSQNGGALWSPDGRLFAFVSTRRNGADRDLYVMDPADPASARLVMENAGGGWGAADWSPDGRTLVVGEYASVAESHLWLVDVATGERTALTPRPGAPGYTPAVYSAALFAPDGLGLYVVSDGGGEFQRLGRLDLATRTFTPFPDAPAWDVEEVALSDDGARLAYVVNEAGRARLFLLDTATGASRAVDGLPVGQVGGLEWHANSRDLGMTVASARIPGDAFSLDAETGALTRWTESELGGLPADAFPEAEAVSWTSFDGQTITGFLYRPPARFAGPRPVVVRIHGGPEAQFQPGALGRAAYLVNELGIALVYPNVRGSTGFGRTFVNADNGMRRMDSVKDIGALLDWIAREPGLDASKVVVQGGSYGGFMTLAVATQYPDRIAGAIDVVGISDFRTFLTNTEAYRRDLRRVEYGDEREPAMAAFFDEISPLRNAARITAPLFIVQGGNDPRVPRTEAEQMRDRVRQNGTPVWYLLAEDEGHGFRKKPNVDFQFYAETLFLRQFLLGEAP